MCENVRIADELDRMAHGGAWHGPAIAEALDGVTARDAATRPVAGAHTIWEIVLHMTAWAAEVERRLWQRATQLTGEEDWPPVGATTEATWDEARSGLVDAHRRLRQAIREFPQSRLQELVPEATEGGSFYVMLHGLAQHDAYHTGQIAILKRAMEGRAAA